MGSHDSGEAFASYTQYRVYYANPNDTMEGAACLDVLGDPRSQRTLIWVVETPALGDISSTTAR